MTVPSHPGRRTGVVVALVAALLVAAVLGVGAVLLLTGGEDSPTPTAGGATPTSSGPSSSAGPLTPPSVSSAPGEQTAPPRATPSERAPGWVALRTPDGWSYDIPDGSGWTSSHDVMAYAEGSRVLVRATQPSYFNAGACKSPRSVARGVVGWATPDAGKTAAEVATTWGTAVAVRDDGSQDRTTKAVTRPMRHAAMEVEKSVVLVRASRAEGCLPRTVKVSAISYRGEGGTRTLVIVRDLGVDGAMPATVEEQIVRGVRHTPS